MSHGLNEKSVNKTLGYAPSSPQQEALRDPSTRPARPHGTPSAPIGPISLSFCKPCYHKWSRCPFISVFISGGISESANCSPLCNSGFSEREHRVISPGYVTPLFYFILLLHHVQANRKTWAQHHVSDFYNLGGFNGACPWGTGHAVY